MSCIGKIQPPPNGTRFIVLPGSTVEIKWLFDDDINTVTFRIWNFIPRNRSTALLASIHYNGAPVIDNNYDLRVKIKKPATLVLKNVNDNDNGMYRFSLTTVGDPIKSEVTVFIASKFSLRDWS